MKYEVTSAEDELVFGFILGYCLFQWTLINNNNKRKLKAETKIVCFHTIAVDLDDMKVSDSGIKELERPQTGQRTDRMGTVCCPQGFNQQVA